jgi:coproporphyrinogen III oxidase
MNPNIHEVKYYLLDLQNRVTTYLLDVDPPIHRQDDKWKQQEGAYGNTRAFKNGNVFEKAGVNFSHMKGDKLPEQAAAYRSLPLNTNFEVVGLSLVIHPLNPYIPTCHANLRFFITCDAKPLWWFGGGFDLTPYYGFEEDCIHWHNTAKKACDPYGEDVYATFKKWADDYFFIKHRNEPRGIGGIFFDDLNQWEFETCFSFLKSVGDHFYEAYFPIVSIRKEIPYGEQERHFQCYRRGRYVEFNLVHDRGTAFGLQSQGRIESILISLPPLASWHYNWQPVLGTKEAELYEKYLPPQDWISKR